MSGIACAGHWVLDYIKFIDNWPSLTESCNIVSELKCNGGAPFNILADLSNLQIDIPAYGIGCIGDDKNSLHILEICKQKKINIDWLHILEDEKTSYTDVTTLKKNGVRTMFHCHGANNKFSQRFVPIEELKKKQVKLFYLGHLLLMDGLEQPDDEFTITGARLLYDVQEAGMETVIDVVTEKEHSHYDTAVKPCLPYIDHLVINELEAHRISNVETRLADESYSLDGIRKAADFLLNQGIKKNVIIHLPEGAFWLSKNGKGLWYPSLNIPKESFIATCGAGDAFCSGILVGLHENWDQEKTLKLAVTTAAASITSAHNSDGIKPLEETLALFDQFGQRENIKHFD